MSRILIITDAWLPQVNGVVTTLVNLTEQLRSLGHEVKIFSPEDCKIRFALPSYPEIRLGVPAWGEPRRIIEQFLPDYVHVSTPEAPLGIFFRRILDQLGMRYSTAYHTKFPEFIKAKFPWFPLSWARRYMRHINRYSENILVPTASVAQHLQQHGFDPAKIKLWTRGIRRDIFQPLQSRTNNPVPVYLCVSRVSSEKNLETFFQMPVQGRKIMVGDGPQLEDYRRLYPGVEFVGTQQGPALASYYQTADVFVFPSKTDTFGIVMIEAMACGTPVAAYDVEGPKDIVINGTNGLRGDNLVDLAEQCLLLDRKQVYESSKIYSWEKTTEQFLVNLKTVY